MKNLLTILLLTMMSSSLAAQAVAVSNTGSIGATSTSSLTLSFTVSANNNRLLIVCVTSIAGGLVTDVTFGGTPMTYIGTEDRGGPRATIFYLVLGSSASPTTGNIVATGNTLKQIGAVAFYNVQQSNPYDGFVTTEMQAVAGQTLPSTISLNVSSRSDDLVCDFFAGNANGATGITANAPNQTERVNNTAPGTTIYLGISTEAGANPSVNMGWTINGTLTTGQAVLLGISVRSVNIPVPIELMSFDVQITEGGKNILTWATGNEINSQSFEIERSRDGATFQAIGTVQALGKAGNYTFTDAEPVNGTNYYRLRQIDFDGTETLSKIVSIERNDAINRVKVYPNPVSSLLTVEDTEEADFQILNLLGQQVLTGKTAQRIDVSTLPQGTYILQAGAEQVRFVKQ
jgi:hypothetical protein